MQSARKRILDTAHDLFYRNGIRATGINRLIDEAEVTKVTFYRHYPSKESLIRAFLEYRHERWMTWFTETLARKGGTLSALAPTLAEWFDSDGFRGCAFINALSELEGELADIGDIVKRHKDDLVQAIAELLPPSRMRRKDAESIALAIDGAIVRAQFDNSSRTALRALKNVIAMTSRS